MFNQLHINKAFLTLIKALLTFVIASIIGSFVIGPLLIFFSYIGNPVFWNDEVQLDFLLFYIFGVTNIHYNLGVVFTLFWFVYLVCFIYCFYKPILVTKINYILEKIFYRHTSLNTQSIFDNFLIITILWFSAYFVISILIDVIQQLIGINLGSPLIDNPLLSFFYLTAAPLNEEIFFRILLLGVPFFVIFVPNGKNILLRTLIHPSKTIPFKQHKLGISLLIITNAFFFGLSHVLFGGGYEIGKITQAGLGGLVLGWLYYRYGIASAIIFHLISNYVLFSYSLLGFILLGTPWDTESNNIFLITISSAVIILGIFFLVNMFKNFFIKFIKKVEDND